MTRRRDTEASMITDTLSEIPAKLMLVVSTINEGNKEIADLLRNVRDEIKEMRTQQPKATPSMELLPANIELRTSDSGRIRTYANTLAKSISESLQKAQQEKIKLNKIRGDAIRKKKDIISIWQNKLNTRKQAFWDHHRAKRTSETYENLLASNPPKMPRKFLPKVIEGEDPEETDIRKQLSVEKFKAEIALLKSRSQKYEKRFLKLDTEMVVYLTESFDENISNILTEEWSNYCKSQEERSVEIFNTKENWYLNNASETFRDESKRKERDLRGNKPNVKQKHQSTGNDVTTKTKRGNTASNKTTRPGYNKPNNYTQGKERDNNTYKHTADNFWVPEWESRQHRGEVLTENNACNTYKSDNYHNTRLDNRNDYKKERDTDEDTYNGFNRIPDDFWPPLGYSNPEEKQKERMPKLPPKPAQKDQKTLSNTEIFDVTTIDLDRRENLIIPAANDIVLVPDTQLENSDVHIDNVTATTAQNENIENNDNFLFHAQGATAIGYSEI